jgi:hypothetical protein
MKTFLGGPLYIKVMKKSLIGLFAFVLCALVVPQASLAAQVQDNLVAYYSSEEDDYENWNTDDEYAGDDYATYEDGYYDDY